MEQKLDANSTVLRNLKKLVELNIIVPDTRCNKKAYRYKSIYDVFVGSNEI